MTWRVLQVQAREKKCPRIQEAAFGELRAHCVGTARFCGYVDRAEMGGERVGVTGNLAVASHRLHALRCVARPGPGPGLSGGGAVGCPGPKGRPDEPRT